MFTRRFAVQRSECARGGRSCCRPASGYAWLAPLPCVPSCVLVLLCAIENRPVLCVNGDQQDHRKERRELVRASWLHEGRRGHDGGRDCGHSKMCCSAVFLSDGLQVRRLVVVIEVEKVIKTCGHVMHIISAVVLQSRGLSTRVELLRRRSTPRAPTAPKERQTHAGSPRVCNASDTAQDATSEGGYCRNS